MSQDQAIYETDQPAAIIDPPRNIKALRDSGLIEYKAWGWVKMSAKFIAHLKFLKGAKLAIWQCIALSIDETGTCKMTLKDIGILTGYSHTEVIASLTELEAGGYMTINRDGKTNIYQPVFVARGEEKPKETLVKKLDSTPVYQYESSTAIENSVPSIKRVKRVNTQTSKRQLANTSIEAAIFGGMPITEEMMIEARLKDEAPKMFEAALGFSRPLAWTSDKDWTSFGAGVLDIFRNDQKAFERFETWRNTPYVKGSISNNRIRGFVNEFYDAWDMFKKQDAPQESKHSMFETLS